MDIGAIVELTREKLLKGGHRSLHVDWYGGEPLLNIEFIEVCSFALQNLCKSLDIVFHASMISNGTRWPSDPVDFVSRHKLRQVQISFDGVGKSHSKVRRLRKGYGKPNEKTTFESTFEIVGKLLDAVRVDVRYNVSPTSVKEIDEFIELVHNADWFNKAYPCVIQPARVSMYSEKSAFIRAHELSASEFEVVLERFRDLTHRPGSVQVGWFEDGVNPKSSVCAALAESSVVIGAEKNIYRCGLQVGETKRAVSKLNDSNDSQLSVDGFPDQKFWEDFDPTIQDSCSECTFLPICWGGCPKKHLEKDLHALEETSQYYRKNLGSRVASEANVTAPLGFEFLQRDQFKNCNDYGSDLISVRNISE